MEQSIKQNLVRGDGSENYLALGHCGPSEVPLVSLVFREKDTADVEGVVCRDMRTMNCIWSRANSHSMPTMIVLRLFKGWKAKEE
jgi:hypothetical protein